MQTFPGLPAFVEKSVARSRLKQKVFPHGIPILPPRKMNISSTGDSAMLNASTEGFNNKIRWLISQAYGLRDREYFKLKVSSLQILKTLKSL